MPFLMIALDWIAKAAWPWIWHALQRFWSVLLVGLVILACWLWWRGYIAKVRNVSCQTCISEYTKTHPSTTVQSGGTVINNISAVKTAGPEINGFGFGFWHRR